MAADIFISYRGADRVLARRLEYRLRSRWGSRVFRDETGVTSGRHWVKELNDAMDRAHVIIALVGPGWHISANQDVEDWVRKELKTAVESGKPILAVLVGDSRELRPKLAAMPEAFQRQAVVVGPELAGFDIHNIAKALGHLGAFRTDDAWTLASRRDEMVPKKYMQQAHDALKHGKSLLVIGSSGSGRNALIQRLVDDLAKEGHLVASYGLERAGGQRHTHAVISGWIQSLSNVFQDLNSPYAVDEAKQSLVKSVLDKGPDLLSRRVVKAGTLLPLGGTQHDQMILEAVRRSTDRWAPFPPTRLRHQSRAVIESLLGYLQRPCDQDTPIVSDKNLPEKKDRHQSVHDKDLLTGDPETSILGDKNKKLILVVDHFDSVDSISGELVQDLLEKPILRCDQVQFIIAAYNTGLNARREINRIEESSKIATIRIDKKDDQGNEKIDQEDQDQQAAWRDHIEPWLDAHGVELADLVKDCIQKESNPYRALAKLWYLVDNGFVKEPPRPGIEHQSAKRVAGKGQQHKEIKDSQAADRKVIWKAVGEGEKLLQAADLITEDCLLDHMIDEHIPVGFRNLVEAGR